MKNESRTFRYLPWTRCQVGGWQVESGLGWVVVGGFPARARPPGSGSGLCLAPGALLQLQPDLGRAEGRSSREGAQLCVGFAQVSAVIPPPCECSGPIGDCGGQEELGIYTEGASLGEGGCLVFLQTRSVLGTVVSWGRGRAGAEMGTPLGCSPWACVFPVFLC